MSKKTFIVIASVIAFVALSMVFIKPTNVKAHDSGCDIVSPSTMYEKTADKPQYSTDDTWSEWINWYVSKGYTYIGYTKANANGVTAYWLNLKSGSELYYALLLANPADTRYTAPYRKWIKVDGAYYYTNDIGIIYRNTWVHTRTNDDYYLPTDAHGYFVFDNSGAMCTGWHKDSNGRWYYMRIDRTYNKDGPSMKVGVDSGFLWKTVKNPTTYSEGLYYFDGINVNTNVYIEDTSGNYGSAKTSTVKYSVGDGTGQVKPLATKTVSADTAYVNRQYNSSYFYINTSHAGSYTGSYNFTISNGDFNSYTVNHFNYYIARKEFTMTLNHKKYNVSTGKYDDWKSETAKAKYGTTYTPAYTTTPTGYSKKSRDCNGGWTVTGNKTFSLYYYPNSYTQTINFYKYTASGTYTGPTHKNELLGSKTYSALYGATFNASNNKAAWGNVEGYHWWKIDKNSWTVGKDSSTNSYYYPNKYRLIVDVAGGSGTNGNFDMEYGTSVDLGTPTRIGYTFNAWNIISDNSKDSKLSGNTFTMGYNKIYPYQDYKNDGTVKIQAQWTPNIYTITYNGNGGTKYDDGATSYSNTATFDSTYHVDKNYFTRDGYWFLGWSTTENGPISSTWLPDTDITMKTADNVTLYAIWEKVLWTASGTKINGDTVFGINTSIEGNVTSLRTLCRSIKTSFELTSDISINPWKNGVDYATPLNYIQYGDMNLYLYTNIENGKFTKVTYEFDTTTGISTVVKDIIASTDTLTVQIPANLTFDELYSVKVTIENPDAYARTSQMVYFTYTKMNMDDLLSRIRKQ